MRKTYFSFFIAIALFTACSDSDSGTCDGIAAFTGSGTAKGACGDRSVTVTNDGVDGVTLNLPVTIPGSGTFTLVMDGTLTGDCSVTFPLDTLTESGISIYYSGSATLSGNTLGFTYRADFSFGSGFDCDYTAVLQ